MSIVFEKRKTTSHEPSASQCRVAYIMSRFPKLTETFILFEMAAVEEQGVDVEVYPLLRARNTATHPEGASLFRKIVELFKAPMSDAVMHRAARPFVERARFAPMFNWPILCAQLWFLFRRPVAYLQALFTLVWANLGSLNYLLGGLAVFPKVVYFARQMERDGVTHVHAHFANHPAAAAYVIHRLTGIPYSFTAHGADLQVDQHMLREKVATAKHVVTISDYNREFIVKYCGAWARDRIRVVRCGVDTSVFDVSNRVESSERLTIVCTGTLYEVKGHTHLIDACRLLDERGVDFECHLIGDGPLLATLQQQVAGSGLEDRMLFRGRLTREEIARQLRCSDVLVAPSVPTASGRREGIPVVLMEAMASGLAVVASSISGIPELVDHEFCGLLVEPRDSDALARAIVRLHDDPHMRQQLGQAAREKVCREYDLDTNAGRLIKLFEVDE